MKRYIRSAGYHGYSMSNNAVDAYENGEMPISKWTKSAIINELSELNVSSEIIAIAKKMNLKQLKEIFLYKSSWHHTSKMYNRTNFYSVNPDVSVAIINNYIQQNMKSTSKAPDYRYCKVYYNEPCYAIYKDHKFYLYKDGKVEKISAFDRKCQILEYYEDVPEGSNQIFDVLKTALV